MQTFPIAQDIKKEASGIVYGCSYPWGKIKDLGTPNSLWKCLRLF